MKLRRNLLTAALLVAAVISSQKAAGQIYKIGENEYTANPGVGSQKRRW